MTHVFLAALLAVSATPTPSPEPASPSPASAPSHAFAPPAGWTQVPPYFLAAPPVDWEDIATHRDGITIMRMPAIMSAISPAQRDRLLGTTMPALFHAASHSTGLHLHVKSTATTICGQPAHILTFGFGNTTYGELFIESGPSVMIVYHHASGHATEEHFLRTLCLSASTDVATLTPPRGWQTKVQMHPIAEWYGPSMGTMLTELEGPVMPSIAGVPSLAVGTIGSHRRTITQTCGAPAIEIDSTVHTGSVHLSGETVLVQSTTASYALTYTTLQTVVDPAIVAAMHDFCP